MTPREQVLLEQILSVQQQHGKTLERINYTLHGNGTPGLKTVVDRHERAIKQAKKVFWIVVTPILAAVGSGIVMGVVFLIRNVL